MHSFNVAIAIASYNPTHVAMHTHISIANLVACNVPIARIFRGLKFSRIS